MPPAYRLDISPEHDRALETLPERIRNELRSRIANAVTFPVSAESGASTHEAMVQVEGYSATLRLDSHARTVTVTDISRP